MSTSKADRYSWTCPICENSYRVKVGHNPDCCPKCKDVTFRPDAPPEPPEWLKNRIPQKAPFIPNSRRLEQKQPSEAFAPSIEEDRPVYRRPRPSPIPNVMIGMSATALLFALMIVFIRTATARDDGTLMPVDLSVGMVLGIAVALGLYLLPTLIAAVRGHLNVIPIAIINIFFGWTFVGYIAVLAWSFSSAVREKHVHHYHGK